MDSTCRVFYLKLDNLYATMYPVQFPRITDYTDLSRISMQDDFWSI